MKILYVAVGLASALHSSLELCRRLRRAGHTVVYASHADLGEKVRAHGHDFVRLEEPAATPKLRLKSPLVSFAEQRRSRRQSIDDDAPVRLLLDELRPDRILADLEMHVVILKLAGPARRRGIALQLILGFFPVHKAPGRPPLHKAEKPPTSFVGRLRLEWLWRRTRLERLHFEWKQRLGRWRRLELQPSVGYLCFEIDDLRATARRHGFDLKAETTRRDWLRPFMYTRLPVLCVNAAELDWPDGDGDLPANVRFVGPMVFHDDEDRATDGNPDTPDAWSSFAAGRDGERPLVYASLGSFWSGDVSLLRHLVDIFARHPEWDLVLGLGRQASVAALGDVPPNVLVLEWAPQVGILKQASAAIVHGGVTTLNECAYLGVPMVVYSTGFVEQNGNAARIDFHGLGLTAATPQDIEPSIRSVLHDPAFRRRLETLRPSLESYEHRKVAVGLIESAEVLAP